MVLDKNTTEQTSWTHEATSNSQDWKLFYSFLVNVIYYFHNHNQFNVFLFFSVWMKCCFIVLFMSSLFVKKIGVFYCSYLQKLTTHVRVKKAMSSKEMPPELWVRMVSWHKSGDGYKKDICCTEGSQEHNNLHNSEMEEVFEQLTIIQHELDRAEKNVRLSLKLCGQSLWAEYHVMRKVYNYCQRCFGIAE